MIPEFNLEWLTIAKEVARRAGDYLKIRSEGSRQINFQDASDVKLQADLDSEHLIRDLLTKKTGLPIVGEEEGGEASLLSSEQFFWVVDPLDGTYNYLRNQPQTCVSIGLMKGSNFISGIIYDFNRDELYYGSMGQNFLINERQVFPRWSETVNQGCVMTGFPSRMDCSPESMKSFINRMRRFKKVRMIGSAALALATVAAGRADVYFEEGTCLWDIAAGAALLIAAGGHIEVSKAPHNNPFVFNCCAVGRKEWIADILI